MCVISHSRFKYEITNAIRQLECLIYEKNMNNRYLSIYDESLYWISTLSMVRERFMLSENNDDFRKSVKLIKGYIDEISSEICNAYLIMNTYLSDRQKEKLVLTWKHCKEAKNLLCKK